ILCGYFGRLHRAFPSSRSRSPIRTTLKNRDLERSPGRAATARNNANDRRQPLLRLPPAPPATASGHKKIAPTEAGPILLEVARAGVEPAACRFSGGRPTN